MELHGCISLAVSGFWILRKPAGSGFAFTRRVLGGMPRMSPCRNSQQSDFHFFMLGKLLAAKTFEYVAFQSESTPQFKRPPDKRFPRRANEF